MEVNVTKAPDLDGAPIYTGTKTLRALPMTRGAYNDVRGWTIPADENPADEGYVVAYADGHVSWSPKATFDASYKASGTFVDRLQNEHDELQERGNKLAAFTQTPAFAGLAGEDQMLLAAQAAAMASYEAIVHMRLLRGKAAI